MDEEQALSPLGYHLAKLPVPPKVVTALSRSDHYLFRSTPSSTSSPPPAPTSHLPPPRCFNVFLMRAQVGKMLLWSVMMRCVEPITTIAACLSFKDPFVCPLHKQVLPCSPPAMYAFVYASAARSRCGEEAHGAVVDVGSHRHVRDTQDESLRGDKHSAPAQTFPSGTMPLKAGSRQFGRVQGNASFVTTSCRMQRCKCCRCTCSIAAPLLFF
jgi:hypothetical protein